MTQQKPPSFVGTHIHSHRIIVHAAPKGSTTKHPSTSPPPKAVPISPISGRWSSVALPHVPWRFISDERRPILMDLEYRHLLAPNGPPLIPPSDFRSPRLPRPTSVEFMQRSPEPGGMEKTPPVTGKRRGGSRKACNECKQQKVSHMHRPDWLSIRPNAPS